MNTVPRWRRSCRAALHLCLCLGMCLSCPHGTLASSAGSPGVGGSSSDWSAYTGGVNVDHYSNLKQITVANVHLLKQVWRVDVGTGGGLGEPAGGWARDLWLHPQPAGDRNGRYNRREALDI